MAGGDLKHGLRILVQNRGFTAIALVTLALGIGTSATMFNALEATVLIQPHSESLDRLASVWATNLSAGWERSPVSFAAFDDWRRQNHSFEALAAFTGGSSILTGVSEPARVSMERVSADFFRVLGGVPVLGRTFLPNENRSGAETPIVLSHRLWQHNFDARPAVLGERLRIDGDLAIVIGVMPVGFGFPDAHTDLWIPLAPGSAGSERVYRHLNVLGRIKRGITPGQAQDEMDLIARREAEEHPDSEAGWGIRVILVRDEMMKKLALGLLGILAPSVCVLFIICANLAGLLLARASTRQPELAVRAALGASRVRLVRQLVTESLLVSLAGGGLGIVVSYWGIRLVRRFLPATVSRDVVQGLHVDPGVLAFILLVSLLAPFAFALAPALTASKQDLIEALKGSGRRPTPGLHGHGLRDSLVALQVTLAMVLLTTVAVWGKAMLRLQRVDTGFDPHNLLTLELSPPASSYSSDNDLLAFYGRVLERTTAVPGIEAVGMTSRLPGAGEEQANLTAISLEAGSSARAGRRAATVRQSVSPDYFSTMRVPLVEGRYFSAQDNAGAPQVALISLASAARFWPGEDPVGKRFKFPGTGAKSSWVTVVGVVGNVMNDRRQGAALSQVYLPYAQNPDRDMTMVARTFGSPASSVKLLRDAVQSVDRDLPLAEVRTMQQVLSLAESYFMTGLVGAFAILALLLAALGVYGVASFMATARTREIGIRLAMGAQRREILRMVAWQGMVFILTGVSLGVLGAIAASLFLWSEVAGVSPADPLALSLSALLLAGTAALGVYLPARRAATVDPIVALRCE